MLHSSPAAGRAVASNTSTPRVCVLHLAQQRLLWQLQVRCRLRGCAGSMAAPRPSAAGPGQQDRVARGAQDALQPAIREHDEPPSHAVLCHCPATELRQACRSKLPSRNGHQTFLGAQGLPSKTTPVGSGHPYCARRVSAKIHVPRWCKLLPYVYCWCAGCNRQRPAASARQAGCSWTACPHTVPGHTGLTLYHP